MLRNTTLPSGSVLHPHALKPKTILHLQRTLGNQAVTRLINPDNQRSDVESADGYGYTLDEGYESEEGGILEGTVQPTLGIQREDVDPETLEWANNTNDTIERIQDAVSSAIDRLNTDANTAITHIRDAQTQYDNFDTMYENAVNRFVSGVEAAQAREQQMREHVKFVATTIFAAAAPTAFAMYEAIDGALSKVQSVASLANTLTERPTAPDTSGGSSPGMAARREDRVEWSELLSTTLTAFETTVRNNSNLNSVSTRCVQITRFLNRVIGGRYTGDSPRTDALATQADDMVNNVDSLLEELRGIDEGLVSGPTETLKNQITERLSGVTGLSLEQDIAIRWMAGLSATELDQIDTADAYLAQIGVTDRGANRLGYDTGAYTDDIDQRILHWRAGWESTAMSLVGETATWLGNPFVALQPIIDDGGRCIEPRAYSGQIRDSRNREWNVSIPRGASPEGGGSIMLTGYEVDHMDSSGWWWSHPGDLQQQLRWEIRFTGQPVGRTGGGAPTAGPVMHAG
jgi:hypothetical protein